MPIGDGSIGNGAIGDELTPQLQAAGYGALFPLLVPSGYDYIVSPKFKTLKIGDGDDVLQRRRMRAYALHTLKLKYDSLIQEEEELLYNFFSLAQGSFFGFGIYDNAVRKNSRVYLGKDPTGTKTTFDLKGKASMVNPYRTVATTIFGGAVSNPSLVTVFLNGTVMDTGWTLTSSTGLNEQDQIVLDVPLPSFDDTLTASFMGCRYFPNCIFSDDSMDRDMFIFMVYKLGLNVQEASA